jgi:hypothetical protein
MKLGGELKMLLSDLEASIAEVRQVIAGLKSRNAAAVMATGEGSGRYDIRSNGRALAEKIVMVSSTA